MKKRLRSKEYAAKKHLSVSQVNRLAREGKLDARKVSGNWEINPDSKEQSLKAPPWVSDDDPERRFKLPPDNPRPGYLFYDMEKERFVPIEKYAKEHGCRIVGHGKRRLICSPDNSSRMPPPGWGSTTEFRIYKE